MTRCAFLAIAGVLAIAACRDVPAPANGVLAVSELLLPAPAVVVGDTLRDSTGHIAKLTVVAFGLGGENDTIRTITPSFVVLDPGAHITSDGYVVGDSVRATPVRIVGTVGTLQTSAANLNVIVLPDSIASGLTAPLSTIRFNILDSTSQSNLSDAISVVVTSSSFLPPAVVQSVLVRFVLASQPAGLNGAATGVLIDASGNPAGIVDTTDVTGTASRRIRLRPAALASPASADSFVVLVSAQYRGVALHGSPVRFVIPVQPGTATTSRIP
jgi:hypothetical protein